MSESSPPDKNPYAVPDALLNLRRAAPIDAEIQIRDHRFSLVGGAPGMMAWLLTGILLYAVPCVIFRFDFLAFPLALVYSLGFVVGLYRRETKRTVTGLLNAHSLAALPNGARLVSIAFDKSQTNRPKPAGFWRIFPADDMASHHRRRSPHLSRRCGHDVSRCHRYSMRRTHSIYVDPPGANARDFWT